jgi:signal peptidase
MSGTFEPGDVVVTANWLEPKVNDIAIYQARDFDGTIRAEFVHRIISGTATTAFEFKGDANPDKDVLPVPSEDIVGVVLFWMPSIGTLLNPKNLLALFSIGIFVYFAAGYIRDELLERKHFKRKAAN